MPRQSQTSPAGYALTNEMDSSEPISASSANKLVPDSFDDWLTQPAATIAAGDEAELELVWAAMNEDLVRTSIRPAA